MIKLHTLNAIIDDILLEARKNNIAESESINRAQIESWIIEYRSMLIKQDIDKGRSINPDYIQDSLPINIEYSATQEEFHSDGNRVIGVTGIEIPVGIDFHFENNIVSIYSREGKLIQLMSEKRASLFNSRKYTQVDTVAYQKYGKLYLSGNGTVDAIVIRGVFENPIGPLFGLTANDQYPIPANMISVLRELILSKEIYKKLPVDTTNDSRDDISQTYETNRNATDRKNR